MMINGINGVNTQAGQPGLNQADDSYSRDIRNQIANAQKQLQDLSSNEDLTLEEKMKKRQEIQQEIANLNQQLRQRQLEQRKEQQSKGASMDDLSGKNQNAKPAGSESKGSGLSQAGMQAMISADVSMKQAQVQGGVAASMEGRAGVLESEIKMDQSRGTDTEKKEAELAEVKQKAVNASASQMNTLASANQEMEEAAKSEQSSKEDEAGAKTESKDRKEDEADVKTESKDSKGDKEENATADTAGALPQSAAYTPIDIRL